MNCNGSDPLGQGVGLITTGGLSVCFTVRMADGLLYKRGPDRRGGMCAEQE